jgi:hypothetical protein
MHEYYCSWDFREPELTNPKKNPIESRPFGIYFKG